MNKLLYVVAFFSGYVMMGFEILGVRVQSAYFGSSVYVWGATIAVIMAGLSVGYAVGGRIADRKADGRVLAVLGTVPLVLISAFPLYGHGICRMVYALELDSRAGALVLSMLLFFFPCIFLGSLLPVIIKMMTDAGQKVGTASGYVYSASTIGSIGGTIFTSFFMISWLSVSTGIPLTGVLLLPGIFISLFIHYRK